MLECWDRTEELDNGGRGRETEEWLSGAERRARGFELGSKGKGR